MKRMLMLLGLLVTVASVFAASASGHTFTPPADQTYCVGGQTMTVHWTSPYYELFGHHAVVFAYGAPGHTIYLEDHTFLWMKGVATSVTAGACSVPTTPQPDDGIFLCYSKYQDQPGVWPEAQAKQLLAQGYWYPYAVSGKVAGGTTIGGYHLTCNVAATQAVSDQVMGGDGTVLGPVYAGLFGYYPVVK